VLLVAGIALTATTAFAEKAVHVRPADRRLRDIVNRGLAQSATFRALVAELELAPVLVLVECDPAMPSELGGRSNLINSVAGVRYVRIQLQCSLAARRQLAMLGHELQHALEIGQDSLVVDEDSLKSHYDQQGFVASRYAFHPQLFESQAAIDIQRAIERELSEAHEQAAVAQSGG
jgi:hypothetical protein